MKKSSLSTGKRRVVAGRKPAMAPGRSRETARVANSPAADNGLEGAECAGLSREEKHHLISKAAYYRAERREFAPGFEVEDWLLAEADVEAQLSSESAADGKR